MFKYYIKMAYIPHYLHYTEEYVKNINYEGHEDLINIYMLLGVYYAYHHRDNNFDGGLSFLDELYKKLHRRFNLNWNVEHMKQEIRTSTNPPIAFLDMLRNQVTSQMVVYYGF